MVIFGVLREIELHEVNIDIKVNNKDDILYIFLVYNIDTYIYNESTRNRWLDVYIININITYTIILLI